MSEDRETPSYAQARAEYEAACERFNAEVDEIVERQVAEIMKDKVVFAQEGTPIPEQLAGLRVVRSRLVPPGTVYMYDPKAVRRGPS